MSLGSEYKLVIHSASGFLSFRMQHSIASPGKGEDSYLYKWCFKLGMSIKKLMILYLLRSSVRKFFKISGPCSELVSHLLEVGRKRKRNKILVLAAKRDGKDKK